MQPNVSKTETYFWQMFKLSLSAGIDTLLNNVIIWLLLAFYKVIGSDIVNYLEYCTAHARDPEFCSLLINKLGSRQLFASASIGLKQTVLL